PAHVAADIGRTRQAIARACGQQTDLFRPPLGFISPRTAAGAKRARAILVAWSARAFDGMRGTTKGSVVRHIERKLVPGCIVLLHDAAEHDNFTPAAVEALPDILNAIEARGLVPVTVPELLGSSAKAAPAKLPPQTV